MPIATIPVGRPLRLIVTRPLDPQELSLAPFGMKRSIVIFPFEAAPATRILPSGASAVAALRCAALVFVWTSPATPNVVSTVPLGLTASRKTRSDAFLRSPAKTIRPLDWTSGASTAW